MRWAEDCAIPVRHHQVVSIRQAVGTCFSAQALLTAFELLEESEVPRDFGRHDQVVMVLAGVLSV
jgi:hypothetical protein